MHMSIRRQHPPILTALRSASAARLVQSQRAGGRSSLADHAHPEPAHPRRHSGRHPAHTSKTTTKRSQTRTEDHFMRLLAESGLTMQEEPPRWSSPDETQRPEITAFVVT